MAGRGMQEAHAGGGMQGQRWQCRQCHGSTGNSVNNSAQVGYKGREEGAEGCRLAAAPTLSRYGD